MKSNRFGFSLIEVLVTLALVGITSSAILALVINMNKYLKSADNKSVEMSLIGDLAQTFSDKEQCKKAITGAGTQVINLNSPLKLSLSLAGASSISEGVTFHNSIVIKELYVDSFDAPVDTSVVGQKKTVGTVWLRTEDKINPAVPRKKRNIGLLNIVYKTSNNEIVDCFSSGLSPNANCESLGFIWNAASQKCKQPAATSCSDLGGTWDGSKCIMPDTIKLANFLGKTCTGSNQALIGFDSNGNPQCTTIVATQASNNNNNNTNTQNTQNQTAQCSGGNQTIKSNDGSNTCVFSWGTVNAGTQVNCNVGVNCSAGGGSVQGTCGADGIWNYTFSCPDKGYTSCPGGTVSIPSSDKTNTCTFTWPMTSDGQTIKPTTATNGGALSGTCVKGVPSYSVNCPGKTVTCPAGQISVGKCYFTYGTGVPGGSPSYLYDEKGFGTASNIKCQANGVWDTSKVVISGCN